MIPKIIHQTWKTSDIPRQFLPFVRTWQRLNPDWEYRLWTDDDCQKFIQREYPWFLELYNSYEKPILRVDAVRYFILYHCGGVYVDLDFECLKPLSDILDEGHTLFLGQEPVIHAKRLYSQDWLLCNAIMGSVSNHSFWPHVFDQLKKNYNQEYTIQRTGPFMIHDAYQSYCGKDVYVYPDTVFYPLPCISNLKLGLTKKEKLQYQIMVNGGTYPSESVAVHHWAGTWHKSWFKKLKERFF